MASLIRFWHLWMPLLDFHLRIPFLEIRTVLMNRCWERDSFQYVAWYIRVFRWHFTVDIYDTRKREVIRSAPKTDSH